MNKILITLMGLALVGGLAGCTTPDESRNGDDDGDRGDIRDEGERGTPEYIRVDGATYECDDTIDLDGVCDGYELNEDADASDARVVSASAGGAIEVGDHLFRCDAIDNVDIDVVDDTNTAGRCERYERAE